MESLNAISSMIFIALIWLGNREVLVESDNNIENLCRGSEKSSCGQCIKIHPQCSWCTDTNFGGEFRCDVEQNLLAANCNEKFIYSPKSKIDKPLDRPIGGHTQLQPQQVLIGMRPGETVTFPLKYMHASAENRDAMILNSETESQGLLLKYSSDCLGTPTEGKTCSGLRPSDRVTFNVSVTLKQCVAAGDAVVSLGATGVRDVVGLYVTPLCGCECEKIEYHEPRSQHCHGWGNLVCGSCVCIGDRGGKNCDCNSSDDSCRASPGSSVCSGRGSCECGQCKCDSPDYYKGKFCECDVTSCPIYNGIMCAGHGQCECGKCVCDHEWSGQICECHTLKTNCVNAADERECSGNGVCRCNRCECKEGFEGDFCESNYEEDRPADHDAPPENIPYETSTSMTLEIVETISVTKPPRSSASVGFNVNFSFILFLFIIMKTFMSL